VGIIELSNRKFRKLSLRKWRKYVEQVIKMHASETKGKDKKRKLKSE